MFENFIVVHRYEDELRINERIFDNDKNLTLKSFFAFCSVFFHKDQRRKDGNDFEKDTVPAGFQNTLTLH